MKLNYRPEIDGLRAVAVILVILYHAQILIFNKNFFKGGFIGVDIFLVISGYLITSLILKEIQSTGKFSLINFYERRARRILPVLFFIMVFSLPFAWIHLLPTDYLDFSKSILFSLGFSSNFYFHFTGQVYGATEGLLKPFLHTWSLSVEEQFYIIFPLFLILSYRFFKKKLFILMLSFCTISLIIAHLTSLSSPSLSFYYLHTRMWELLAGSILAYLEIKQKSRLRFESNLINKTLPPLGFFLIAHSVLFFDDNTLHPSIYTLSPIIGVCLILWFSNKNELVGKIFSSKIFVGTGLISYSLYLWHFPVFALFRYSLASGSLFKKALLVLFIITASLITYFFIERPFRNRKIVNINKLIIFLLSLMSVLVFLNLYIIKNNGFDNRYTFDKIKLDNGFYRKERESYQEKIITTKSLIDKTKILIIGNSHAKDFFHVMHQNNDLFNNYEFTTLYTEIYCFESYFKDGSLCDKKINEVDVNNFKQSEIIILSSRWTSLDINKDKINSIIINLKKTGKKIILTTAAPEFKTYGKFTIIDRFILSNNRLPSKKESFKLKKEYFKAQANNATVNSNNKFLKSVALDNKIQILDKNLYHCNYQKKECDFFTDNDEKINYDKDHYTLAGAKYFGKKIKKINWFKIN